MPIFQSNDLNTLLDLHGKQNGTKVALIYTDTQGEEQKITYKQFRDLTIYNSYYLWPKDQIPIEENTVVGILAPNCIEYCTLVYSLIRARAVSLNLSTKNSADGMIHLLKEGKASVLAVHPQFIEMAKDIRKAVPAIRVYLLTEHKSDEFNSIPNLSPKANETFMITPEMESLGKGRPDDMDRRIMYIHTSGSTLFPKLITQGSKQILAGLRYCEASQREYVDSESISCAFLPLFHVASNICDFLRMMYHGATYVIPPSHLGTFIPTGHNIINTMKRYQPTLLILVPWMLEQVYFIAEEDPTVYPLLHKLRVVIIGGAAFSEHIATNLVKKNVNLVSMYGLTETTGLILTANPDPADKNWNLLTPVNPGKASFVSVEGFEDEKELTLCADEPVLAPGLVINPETRAFHTGDLFVETPVGSGKWMYKGRYDDILVHDNGEKTRPLPIEKQLMADGKGAFKNVAILGADRSGTCLFVELSKGYTEKASLQLARDLVEIVNRQIPKHSRIRKNMIYILPPNRILPCTPKGNIARKKIMREYEKEIDELFEQVNSRPEHSQLMEINEHSIKAFLQRTIAAILDEPCDQFANHSKSLVDMGMDSMAAMEFHGRITSQIPELNLPFSSIFDYATIDALGSHIFTTVKKSILEHDSVCQFLQTSIANILDVTPDIFEHFTDSLVDLGMDSIAAMEFRNVISKRFSFLDLPYSFVFEHPTIDSLSKFLIDQEGERNGQDGVGKNVENLDEYFEKFVSKYTIKDIVIPPSHPANESDGISILMTGGSGYLGVHVLDELLVNNKVSHIYCLIRGNNAESCQRKLVEAFDSFHLSKEALSAHKNKLTVFPCDLSDAHFGLSEKTYEHLKKSVTHIYHGAWRMDFNSNLEAFEPTCLLPTLNLAKFALSEFGLKQYIFISSIGACAADTRPLIPEAPHPSDIRIAMPMGYSQSKLVAEEALVRMGKQGLPVTIVRYGQISGNSESGAWNTREQFPILIRNAVTTGIAPIVTLPTDWIPVNIGAKSLVDLIMYPKERQENINVYHQVNPHPTEPWTEFIQYVSHITGRKIRMLPLQEWWTNLQQLAQADENLRTKDPIYTLLPYLEKMTISSNSFDIRLDMRITCERSPTLANDCPIIDESLISRYLTYWKQIGFLNDLDLLPIPL